MSWKKIWNQKTSTLDFSCSQDEQILQELLFLNGFDTKSGSLKLQDYRDFVQEIFIQAKLKDYTSIFEVGCGAGAFLFALNLVGGGGSFKSIGGMDYAKNLILYAREVFPQFQDNFYHQDARYLEKIDSVDVMCTFSVMHYFSDLEYARFVMEQMFQKAKKCVLFLDVLDFLKKSQDIEKKRQLYGQEYEKMYGNLPHLYYRKEMFLKMAKRYGFVCKIQDQNIKNYLNSEFRFNVIATKE